MQPEAALPREQALFAQAAELADAAARDAFLRRECGDDAALLERLRALLAAHEAATGFMPDAPRQPAVSPAAYLRDGPAPHDQPTLADAAQQARARPEEPGDVIGRYWLIERLGAGGMGEVFLAEQREPVVRRVALKVIKLGMDTREVVARFGAERQALALMDHPGIARVFDAGATDHGRPYFVMEHVAGVPITRFCDEQRLDLRQRLGLFLEVCSAVQHAHQKGVIHRDLKPSNVLVAVTGDRPLPKVIDFGIAKATQEPLTDLTFATRPHHVIGTPAYMSPEQAGLGGLDVDTRSDIYSLGVLLYELLTGTLPFDPRAPDLLALIREQDPPLPSARVRSLDAAAAAAFRERRRIEARQPHRLLAGDLDWITARALEKDRARRYETANALAQDLRRFLADEPVAAAAPSTPYRIAKFVRRHRTPVAAAAVIALLLAAGITVSTWLAVEANRARRAAVREAENRGAVARFLEEMLDAASPARARGRDTALLKEILDGTAARLAGELAGQPDVRHQLSRTIGRTYEAIGSVSNALAMQEAALVLAGELYGPTHPEVARAHLALGLTRHRAGQYAAASNDFAAALELAARPGGDPRLAAVAGFRLGSLASALGHPAEAERLLLGARAVLRGRPGAPDLDAITCDGELAALYYRQNRLAEMEPLVLAAVADRRRLQGEDHPSTLNDLTLLALLRQSQGMFTEAETAHREIVATRGRILGHEHPFTLTSRDHLALVLGMQGRHAEAEAISRAILPPFERQFGPDNRDTLALRSNLAEHLRNQGKYAEAERLFRETMAAQAGFMAAEDPFRLETQNGLALLCFMQGRLTEAEALTRGVLAARRASLATDDPALGDALAQLTLVLLEQRRFTEAAPLAREALAIRDQGPADDWRRFVALSQLGGTLLGLGRTEDAGPPLREGYEGLKAREARLPAIEHARLREAAERLLAQAVSAEEAAAAARWRAELNTLSAPAGSLEAGQAPH